MVAYIVGMITGAICLVFPLVYLMHIDRCVVEVLSAGDATVEQFLAHTQHSLAYGTAAVGAIVLLISTVLVALAGTTELRARRRQLKAGRAPQEPSAPPDVSAPA